MKTQTVNSNHIFDTKITIFKIILFSQLYQLMRQAVPSLISDTIVGSSRGKVHQVSATGYSPGDVIQIGFTIISNTPLTSTSLMVNTRNTIQPTDVQLASFYHTNPISIESVDLDAMWDARTQYINIYQPLVGPQITNLYLTVFKFDPGYRQEDINYQIIFGLAGQTTKMCDSCLSSEPYYANSCVCRNCQGGREGKLCQRTILGIQKDINVRINPSQYQYFKIQNTNKITLTIQVRNGQAQIYLQFQQFAGQVANFYNVAKSGDSQGRYFISNNILKVGADTQQRNLMITLVNLSNFPITATISWVEESVSVLIIVMSVLGGLLFIILIIAIVCIIKKRNQINARVQSQINVSTQNNKLTGEQIQRYFPQAQYNQVINNSPIVSTVFGADTTTNQLDNSTQKQMPTSVGQDCVICLQPINYQDQIRMGYCKHMFHGACLIGWFKKQRNCPYCRKQYSREETTAQFNKLVKQNQNKVVKGVDLLKAIYFKKAVVSQTIVQNLQ